MSVQEQQQRRKRKQPPTFQHLHPSQAKKLKKAWIEKAQIKSKWSREKRKLQDEGVIPAVKKPWEILGEEQEGTRNSDGDPPTSRPGRPDPDPEGDQEPSEDEREVEERPVKRTKHTAIEKAPLPPHLRHNGPTSSSSRSAPRQQRPEKTKPKSSWQVEIQNGPSPKPDLKGKSKAPYSYHDDQQSDEELQKSLRDLKREAYDKKNLHNFRADPLHKHTGRRGQFNSRGRGGRGGRGGGGYRGREARGQPNMKLRMDYMLEKIKRDYAAPSA